ncbi:dTDP-4-dehydrorhamnose reductase [Tateyamaria sp.]|uniref:dTDP-4-dehydrorhamnose reductase n=1 Tax=Tateyamaria sp. TaxID=1929288 RepID=UPI0032A106CE
MSILVFGQTGQVATELQRQAPVIALGRAQADLNNPADCAAAIRVHAPSAVINAAAYTAVDKAEEEQALAYQINAAAPGAMARTCADLGIPFLHVSTDYVFAGTGTKPWQPNDPTAPLGAYGASKRAGEEAVIAAGGTHAILRTSWVFSAHGANFVKTMLRLSETRDALNVVADQIGGPTPAADIAATLLHMAQAMIDGQGGGLYHYAGAPDTSWACFARETFAQAGRKITVSDIPTADYPTPAARPLNSRMNCTKLETDFNIPRPDWTAGLHSVLKDLGHD